MKTVWIVGKNLNNNGKWDFQGVFDNLARARMACYDINDFVAPANMNEEIPQESGDWPGAHYPLRYMPL
jgi:hypothetical protein